MKTKISVLEDTGIACQTASARKVYRSKGKRTCTEEKMICTPPGTARFLSLSGMLPSRGLYRSKGEKSICTPTENGGCIKCQIQAQSSKVP